MARNTENRGVLPATAAGRWATALVLLAALGVRVAVVILTRHSYVPRTDPADFDMIARSLAAGHGMGPAIHLPGLNLVGPTAYRAPLYPSVLAAAYRVFGASWSVGRLENAVIGVMAVASIGIVASQLWGRRVGFIALAIAAVHPTMVLYGSSLNLEPLLMLMLMLTLAAALQYRRAPHWGWLVLTGALLGLAVLTRELGWILAVPVAWLVWTADGQPWRAAHRWTARGLAVPGVVVLVAALAIVPWTIRNAIDFHAFVPVSTSPGLTLAGVFNETSLENRANPAAWQYAGNDPTLHRLIAAHPGLNEAQLNSELEHADVSFIAHHLGYIPKVMVWGGIRLFDLRGTNDARVLAYFVSWPTGLTLAAVYASYVLEGLALIGILLPATRRAPKAIWLIPVLALVSVIMIGSGIRLRASIEPFTILLAAQAIAFVVAGRTHALQPGAAPDPVGAPGVGRDAGLA